MKRVKIQQAIIDAIDETDPSLARFQNQMMKHAKYIERAIGSKYGYKIKSVLLNVTGSVEDLPDDCYRVVMILPGDYTDQYNAMFANQGYVPIRSDDDLAAADEDYTWLWVPQEVSPIDPSTYEEVAEQLIFPADYQEQELTLIYQFIETDENGFWIVNESHIDAIKKFVIFKMAKKYIWKLFKSDKLLRQGKLAYMRELEREYSIAVRHARAEDGRESTYQKEFY